jgi:putative Holliday junction resolvase
MAVRNLAEIKGILAPGERLAGLDLGSRTIGMAVSDPGLAVASPIGTIRRTKFTQDLEELVRAFRDRSVGAFVIGLPLDMDGARGPAAQSAGAFARNLVARPEVFGGREPEVVLWDERMSTMAVERFLVGEADMTRKRRGEVVDRMAAAYILQGALDALRRLDP